MKIQTQFKELDLKEQKKINKQFNFPNFQN
jgi:hypothetical protein